MVMQSNLVVFVLVGGLGEVGVQGRGWQGASEQGQPIKHWGCFCSGA